MRIPILPNCAAIAMCTLGILAACGGEPGESSLAPACSGGLAQAEQELRSAEAKGLSSSVRWTKAATLIGAARVQEQFEEYQNCVIKVRDARAYLRGLK